jgi:hypothetical protein
VRSLWNGILTSAKQSSLKGFLRIQFATVFVKSIKSRISRGLYRPKHYTSNSIIGTCQLFWNIVFFFFQKKKQKPLLTSAKRNHGGLGACPQEDTITHPLSYVVFFFFKKKKQKALFRFAEDSGIQIVREAEPCMGLVVCWTRMQWSIRSGAKK